MQKERKRPPRAKLWCDRGKMKQMERLHCDKLQRGERKSSQTVRTVKCPPEAAGERGGAGLLGTERPGGSVCCLRGP